MQRAVERFFQLSLLGLVSAGFLAVTGSHFLDTPTVLLVALGLTLRAAIVAGFLKLHIPDLAVNLITIAYIAFFAADYFFLSRGLLEATVHLVCFLAVMKVLTARTNRDYLYTASIALVELVAAAMLSVNLNFFAYLAVYLICAIAAATSAEVRRGMAKPVRLARHRNTIAPRLIATTALISVGILVLTGAMFIVLPRSANAAFRRIVPTRYHLSGFSNEVTLGDIGEIQKDTRAVLHVLPYSQSMPANLKWRGTALSHFDGHKWTDPDIQHREVLPRKSPIELAGVLQRSRRDGRRFSYRVDLNVTDSDALFLAGTPEFLQLSSGRAIRTATGGLRFASAPVETLRYEASSFLPYQSHPESAAQLLPEDRARYLELPPLDPRIPALAAELGPPHAIERYLRTQFGYTLELPSSAQPDPLAHFLFERRKGHCEYFASAMAIMLRTQGTPARIVNGFQSGTFNPISGLYVIRASDAHSWVEAWLPGSGWTTFDPTPPVARAATNAVLSSLALYLDAAQTFWQEWVVNYDLNHQIAIAERLQESTQQVGANWNPHLQLWRTEWTRWILTHKALLIAVALFFCTLPFAIPLILQALHSRKLRSGRATHADARLLYRRMLHLLKTRGYEKPAWFTAAEFAHSLPASPLSAAVHEFTAGYQAFRYGNDASALPQLTALLQRMRAL